MSTLEELYSAQSLFGNDDEFLLALNQCLLNAIARSDYETYSVLCADDMTCFEPESCDCLVKGKAFHKFYFGIPRGEYSHFETTMCDTHVRCIGKDVAIVTYVRLNQSVVDGKAMTTKACETRIWERRNLEWKNVHFHRS